MDSIITPNVPLPFPGIWYKNVLMNLGIVVIEIISISSPLSLILHHMPVS